MVHNPSRIPSLDGLRAISIMLVVLGHLVLTEGFPLPAAIDPERLNRLAPLGVRVFFVISGFLISNLLFQELDKNRSINLGKFYFRRTLRIFPPYYFFILVMIVLNSLNWFVLSGRDILHSATYTVNYYPQRSWVIGHAWSLSVEEQFYLIWSALLLLVGKRRGLWIALSFFLLAPLIRLGYLYFRPSLDLYEVHYRFETTADAIAIGCLLAGVYPWLLRQPLFHKVVNSKLFLLVPFLVLIASEINPLRIRYLILSIPFQNIGIAACVAWLITYSTGWVGRVLNARPVVFIGVMSYSIYLWQQLFTQGNSALIINQFPLNIFLIALAALASFYLIERPSLQLRQSWENRTIILKKAEHQLEADK